MKIPPIGFETDWHIHTYEVDNRQKMTVPALVRIMQEAAMQNAIQLNFSIWDFEAYNFNWVLMQKQMNVYRLPKMGERVRVGTYPAGFYRFFAYRDYAVFDDEGEVLATSASKWLLIDLDSRKIVTIPDFVQAIKKDCPPEAQCLPRPRNRLQKFGQADYQAEFRVNWHDLDFNEHLNNVHYITWMLEALPKEVLQGQQLQILNIMYKEECYWKDPLSAQAESSGNGKYQHRLINQQTGKEVARMDTFWQ
jgi:acyl-ACP thioesterase